ncbi:Phosphoglycolate phosphatase 2 [Eumeta japonica]|uniref:Phosphoglycolate phosphatase 2 n=1 Tax=Eumeta variegata TaxID=151549 RepID=A0A4C1SFM8_EUMVA|nr:Phosphoglycolate phosphatase 2 [Eumeta japonica]
MAPVRLKDLKSAEVKKFLDDFDVVMSDMDGTIYFLRPLPGVPDFFNHMERFGKSVYYISNNCLLTPDEYSSRMKKCSLNVPDDNILYPTKAVIDYLKTRNFDKYVFCIAAQETIDDLKAAGIKCKTGPVPGPRRYLEYPAIFKDDPEVGAVFIDIDFHINMAKAYLASVYLERLDVYFLTGASDQTAPLRMTKDKSPNVFLPNLILPTIQRYTGREPIVLSKPSKAFADFVNKHTGVVIPARVLFIGDSLESDITFGKMAGYKTLLVLTTMSESEMTAYKGLTPDYYAKDLDEVAQLFTNL